MKPLQGCLEHIPCGSAGKESACTAGDLGSIPGLGRSPGEGKGYPLQYSGLENSMGCKVHGVTKSRTRLSGLHRTALHLGCIKPNSLSIKYHHHHHHCYIKQLEQCVANNECLITVSNHTHQKPQ